MALGSISTARAAQPTIVKVGCFAVADFTFRQAVEALTTECAAENPDADNLVVAMCFMPADEPRPDPAGPQSNCPVCPPGNWDLACSVIR